MDGSLHRYILSVIFLSAIFNNTYAADDQFFWKVRTGKWETTTNWNPKGLPVSGDEASILNGGTAIIDNITGTAYCSSCYISPTYGNSTDTLIIDGNSANLNVVKIIIGNGSYSDGTLILKNGGKATCTRLTYVGNRDGAGKVILESGSTFSITDSLILGVGSALRGVVSGTGIVETPLVRLYKPGILSAGDTDGAIGKLTINGKVELQSGSTLQVDLGASNTSDTIAVSGAVLYNGTDKVIIDLTSTQIGDFTILSAAGGGLDKDKFTLKLNGADLPADFDAVLSVSGNNLILTTTTKDIATKDITIDDILPLTYNGQPQEPALTIKDNDTPLILNANYTVDYGSNNKNAGTVTATITGIGQYYGTTTKKFVIQPKPITVTAGPRSKVYGDPDPALTYTVDLPLASGDVFTGRLNRVAGENAGTYEIRQGTLAINDGNNGYNYQMTYVKNYLTIIRNQTFAVTLSANEGINLLPSAGTHAATIGGSFTFYITLAPGFEGHTPQATVNGDPVALTLRSNGTEWMYTIPRIYDDTRVIVSFATTANEAIDAPQLYSRDGQLFIETARPLTLTVYSATGQQVVARRIAEGTTALPLPAGVFIVRMDETVHKVTLHQ